MIEPITGILNLSLQFTGLMFYCNNPADLLTLLINFQIHTKLEIIKNKQYAKYRDTFNCFFYWCTNYITRHSCLLFYIASIFRETCSQHRSCWLASICLSNFLHGLFPLFPPKNLYMCVRKLLVIYEHRYIGVIDKTEHMRSGEGKMSEILMFIWKENSGKAIVLFLLSISDTSKEEFNSTNYSEFIWSEKRMNMKL